MNDTSALLNELRIDRRAQGRRRRRWPWLLLGVVVLIGGFITWGARRPVAVEVATARAADADGPVSLLDASGFVSARRIATVSSKITGKVAEVLIEEGQRVDADQVLARLDATDAQAQLELAQAQLASAESQLAEARAQLRLAEQTLTRQRDLAARRLVAQAALDAAVAERESRAARLASLDKAVRVAREQVELARIGVDHTIVRAPFAGVIVAKAAQPGEMVSPLSAGGGFTRTGIGTLVDMDSLEVQVDVNEAYIGRVQPGMPVEAVLNAYPEWKIPGRVIAIIPTADRTKATVKVRIALDQRDPRIVPDMGVRVSFLEQREPGDGDPSGAWVPARAVVKRDNKPTVFIVANDQAQAVMVETGPLRDADQLVTQGLRGGETVILSPPERLRNGQAVVARAP